MNILLKRSRARTNLQSAAGALFGIVLAGFAFELEAGLTVLLT